jgi:hypothetical protein
MYRTAILSLQIISTDELSEFVIFRLLSGGCDEGRTYTGNDPRTEKNFLSSPSSSTTRQFSAREAATNKLGVSFLAISKDDWSIENIKIRI